jgi:hypothetical protein
MNKYILIKERFNMFYHDYQAMAQLKQLEVEKKAKHAWKAFDQPELKQSFWRARAQKQQPKCCPATA